MDITNNNLMAVFDKYGMYEILENIYSQVEKGYELGKDISFLNNIENIVVAGVGGSVMPGHILKQYLKDFKIPVFVIEDYNLPEYVNKDSLIFLISYSGNTDETISMYKEAFKRGCQLITIGNGGKIKELSIHNKTKHILIPSGMQGRLAYPYMFFPILKILENSNIIDEQRDYINKTVKILKHNKFEEITENLAEKIISKTPIIYTSTMYEAVARKWKQDFNETTETQCFYNTFPGAFYNDIAGLARKNSEFYILFIKGDDENKNFLKKEALLKGILKELNVPLTEINITGECYLAKIFSAMLIGDWLSYNLAIKKGVEPSSRRIIDELEKRMQL